MKVSLKWYKEVGIEILFNTNIGIIEFMEKIIQEILHLSTQIETEEQQGSQHHRLVLSGKKVDVLNVMKKFCNKVKELMSLGLPDIQAIGHWISSCKIVF